LTQPKQNIVYTHCTYTILLFCLFSPYCCHCVNRCIRTQFTMLCFLLVLEINNLIGSSWDETYGNHDIVI